MYPGLRVLGAVGLLTATFLATPLFPAHAGASTAPAATTNVGQTPQGKILQLAIDPKQTMTIYAGTDSSGVYRSDDGGATWSHVGKGLPDSTAISGLVVDSTNDKILYTATEKGVYKSVDRADHWASQGPPTASGSTSVTLDPTSANTLYASTAGDGIYRSANGGATWAAIGPRQATVQVVATAPVSTTTALTPTATLATTLYAGTDDGLLFSKTLGTWLRAGLGHVGVQALAISASAPNLLYVGTAQGLLLSRDGGVSWARAGLRDVSVSALYVDPLNALTVYAASSSGGGLFRTLDGGKNWRALVAGLSSQNISSLAFDPNDPRVAYVGLDKGVFKSLQAGASWASSSIYDRSVFALLQPATTGGTFYAGTNGGIYTSTDGGTVWSAAGLGNHTVSSLLNMSDALIAATEAGIYRTTDGGHSWAYTLRFPAYALLTDPSTPGAVYAGTGAGLFHSVNGGQQWVRLPAGSDAINALLGQPDGTIFAGGLAGVLVSTDNGVSFTRHSVNGETVAALLAARGTSGATLTLYARTSSGHIYRAAGKTWTDRSVGDAQAATLTQTADGLFYAATDRGIYRSDDGGVTWVLTQGQPVSVHPLVVQPSLGGGRSTLLEGLEGQGVIVSTLQTNPVSPYAPIAGTSRGQFVSDTGHFIGAPFLSWYNSHNGAALLGSPRTEALREDGTLVQYFQRARLVYHPEFAHTPRAIALSPLGQQALAVPAPRIHAFENTTKRRYFPQTGHSLSGQFLSFWRAYGGTDVFGYPISEPTMDHSVVAQYFQNVRLEVDTSVGDGFYNTRLTPLGDAMLKQRGWLS